MLRQGKISAYLDRNIRWWSGEKTVEEIIETFRREGPPHKIMYFYVVDEADKLTGIVPVRRVLSAQPSACLRDLLLPEMIFLRESDTMESARAAFALHKFLAFPVVDQSGRLTGIIDIEAFAGDLGEVDERTGFDDVYELLGMRSADAFGSRWKIVRARINWLFTTFLTGFLCTLLVSHYGIILQNAIFLAFFLTLVLGVNESIAMQSAGIAIQKLHNPKENKISILKIVYKELPVGIILGVFSGSAIGFFSYLWRQNIMESLTLFFCLIFTNLLSSIIGALIPHVLHQLKLDAKVAAAPIALGLTDLATLAIYFALATSILI